ncbi:MAG: nucleoside monophosphate kinase [Patescibacteria group bacterium]
MQLGTYIIIGRSGSGKGTQAKLLIEEIKRRDQEHGVFYLESGDGFRQLLTDDNLTAELARQISDAGQLQPAFLAIHVWSHLFISNMKSNEHLVIDGTPRKLNEARILAGALRFYGRIKPTVIYVDVSRKWATERLLARHRSDDEIKNVEGRLNWFDTDVLPAIEYFRDEQDFRVIDINGEQEIEKVHNEIISKIF